MSKECKQKDFETPDWPSRCTWKPNADPKTSPHTKETRQPRPKIFPDILKTVGETPLVRLNRIPQAEGLKCDVFVKCEYFNPGGSVKDRIGIRMLEDAEKKGLIKPGDTLIEPSSGNTGIGVALACAVKGYRCIIVMAMKMSNEKVNVLKALGAEIVRVPTEAAFDSPEGSLAVAQRLRDATPNSYILNQYKNSGNPLAHYDHTAMEIYEQCDGKIDMVVIGAGTGGTVTGIGRRLKELIPNVQVIASDPYGSILAAPDNLNEGGVGFYEVEGIGYDFIPVVLDRSVVDKWVKTTDKESFIMAKRLIREEGLLSGGSSGANVAAALKAAKNLKEGQKCVVILPDSIRNYLTKFVSEEWMEAKRYISPENIHNHSWWDDKVSNLQLEKPKILYTTSTCQDFKKLLDEYKTDTVPVLNENGHIEGITSSKDIMTMINNKRIALNDPIIPAINKKIIKVDSNTSLGLISRILHIEPCVIVTEGNAHTEQLKGIVTNTHLFNYISSLPSQNGI
ncbi:cystathionine beta-synthase [Agrilus planipennis]|uniref:Cystathionine beta-synthase n=1 Tax=Agrilus planipennis TaxID=224129 RepID=A0A1W4XB60_AGRPL|nr:cystathionine beta-synthase [Agrilus planipennis]XP_018333341.1 cystathionine beta-synthase [Agrilus planipennis]